MTGNEPRNSVGAGLSRSPTVRNAAARAADAAPRRGRELCLVHAQQWPAGAVPKDRIRTLTHFAPGPLAVVPGEARAG
ncbi:hypothetical protein [Streptomyces sp. YGL11-2]|uniref:hypothetical protein n=1 Tax=Streptomyces sp. YGL11-2 TaxID=3414028 RepID=UPI003CF56C4F